MLRRDEAFMLFWGLGSGRGARARETVGGSFRRVFFSSGRLCEGLAESQVKMVLCAPFFLLGEGS